MMNKSRVNRIIANFTGKRVAVLGDLMLDVYVWGSASRISQEAPVPVVRIKEKSHSLGGAANVMRNVASLGGTVAAYGVIGEDEDGATVRLLLDERGVDYSAVMPVPGRRTTMKKRVIAAGQQLLRIDYEDTDEVPAATRGAIAEALVAGIESGAIDAVIYEDYNKGLLDDTTLARISAAAESAGIIQAFDPHPGHELTINGLTVMTPNRAEAFAMARIFPGERAENPETDTALAEVAGILRQRWNPDYLLITLGSQGMALFDADGGLSVIPTRAMEVFDVSGAGDTVISTFTLALLAGADGREAAEIANHAAGVVVGKVGTVTVSPEELAASFTEGAQ